MVDKIRFIVLIDFSPYSQTIAELGKRWSQIAGAELLLLHQSVPVIPAMSDREIRAEIAENEKEEALEKLRQISEAQFPGNGHLQLLVSEKEIPDQLQELRTDTIVDYIFLGIKGTGFLKKIFIGSTANTVINSAAGITVAVPSKLCTGLENFCNLIPENIIVAINDRFVLNETAFRHFTETFRETIRRIQFISIIENDDAENESLEYLEELRLKFQNSPEIKCQVSKGSDVLEELKTIVCAQANTVLVVQKGSRALSDQLFRKYLINQLIDDASLPLVVLP